MPLLPPVVRLAAATLGALALAAAAAGPAGSAQGAARDVRVPSPALAGQIRALVVLPSGYETSTRRYPVVYFLHGLPASPFAYRGVGFLRAALSTLPRQAILVAPQGARDGDGDSEYLDRGRGRNWESAIARDLPRWVDAHFRTIPRRDGRALVGLSAGGYGATLVALHHLDDFGVIESWSGYFHPTDPAGTSPLDLGSPRANANASAHALVSHLRADARRRPTFLAFYVGNRDVRFRRENEQLDTELRAAGVPHVFAVYPGGHASAVWSAHARAWLGLALVHLSPAS